MATIEEYLLRKYGRKGAIKVGKFIADSFGIPYPLSKGWLKTHGPREVTPYMIEKLGIMAGVKQPKKDKSVKIQVSPRKSKPEHSVVVVITEGEQKSVQTVKLDVRSKAFLTSYEWRTLRMKAIKMHGAVCACCGASPKTGAVINVDHIKPRKTHPHLALDINNLQVLCDACNHGKGNWDQTDWRK